MEDDKLFETLAPETVHYLFSAPVDCECNIVKIQKSQQGLGFGLSSKDQYQHTTVRLQIRCDYVLQLTTESDHVISGFQCSIDKTFKLLRSSTSDQDEVGEVNGVEFRSSSFPKTSVFLYLSETNKQSGIKNLQKFSEILGKKYIIQDGFHDIYRAIKKIGKGVTASVYKAIRLSDQKELAVKSFKKDQYFQSDNGKGKVLSPLKQAAFQKEFKTMTQIDSSGVSKLVGVFESQNSIYIVMELFSKSLYAYLKMREILQLAQTREIMRKLLIGLRDIHSKNLMHRDLKLQNIMVLEHQSGIQPKIIDFGLAQNWHNLDFLYLKCGTPGYVAPQILNLNSKDFPRPPYSYQCDIFSMGVIFYMLLTGRVLFDGSDEREVIKKNKDCQIDFDFTDQQRLNEEMKDLLRKMLNKDSELRPSAEDLLAHEFFKPVKSSEMENESEI